MEGTDILFFKIAFFRDKMFPAFGFGAQIPPSFQVMERVNALPMTAESAYFRRRMYIQS